MTPRHRIVAQTHENQAALEVRTDTGWVRATDGRDAASQPLGWAEALTRWTRLSSVDGTGSRRPDNRQASTRVLE